jgi:signal peptidase I
MNQKEKITRALKIVAKVFWWGATILVALLIVSIIGAKAKGEVPYFFGYSIMNIVSGSMEDEIPAGTYILIKKVDAKKIKEGDIICFYSDDPAIKGYPNTHVVIEPPIHGENGIEFVTKGTANPDKDRCTAKGDKLIGKHITNLYGLTRFNEMLQGDGMFVFLIFLTGLCVVFMIVPMFMKASEQSTDTADDKERGDDSAPRA